MSSRREFITLVGRLTLFQETRKGCAFELRRGKESAQTAG